MSLVYLSEIGELLSAITDASPVETISLSKNYNVGISVLEDTSIPDGTALIVGHNATLVMLTNLGT